MGELSFFATVVTALAFENTVFSRALGLNKPVLYLKNAKTGMIYGGVFTWVAVFSSMLCSFVNYLLMDAQYARYVRSLGFLISVGIVYIATTFLVRRFLPVFFQSIRRVLPLTTFNTALFGALYMSIQQDFSGSAAYALGIGAGYTVAIMVIHYAQKRIAASPVPRSFRGIPVLLVYLGILSMALFGLIGHSLPT